jgi:hypothetical protein
VRARLPLSNSKSPLCLPHRSELEDSVDVGCLAPPQLSSGDRARTTVCAGLPFAAPSRGRSRPTNRSRGTPAGSHQTLAQLCLDQFGVPTSWNWTGRRGCRTGLIPSEALNSFCVRASGLGVAINHEPRVFMVSADVG